MLQRRESPNGVVHYASPLLESAGVPHAFSTRLGGVSEAPFASLNLGNPASCATPDPDDRIEANYARLAAAIGCVGRQCCSVQQVHGSAVVAVAAGQPHDRRQQADALLTDDPARLLAVRVADCVPILLATADGRAVAAVHAGWRGVVAGVVPAALQALHRTRPAAPVVAAVGPCIGADAFEVGPEVLDAFAAAFGPDAPVRRRPDGKGHVDLRRAVRRQLLAAGLPDDAIDLTDRCTVRHADEFFSHRRDDGLTGRMAAVVSPRGPA